MLPIKICQRLRERNVSTLYQIVEERCSRVYMRGEMKWRVYEGCWKQPLKANNEVCYLENFHLCEWSLGEVCIFDVQKTH